MRRRALIKSAPVAATLPMAGCLDIDPGDRPDGEGESTYPEEWRHVDPLDSGYVAFEAGAFETTAGDPPAVGDTLDGNEAWQLVTEMSWALRETSFQLAIESDIVEGKFEGTWRQTLWRNAAAGVVYQRQEIEHPEEGHLSVQDYNDGTRYVASDRSGVPAYFYVPEPHWHRDRVDTFLMMPMFQLSEFAAEDTVTVDGTDLRFVRHTDDTPDRLEMESAAFFVGEDGIVRNAHADYGTTPDTPTEDRYAVDAAVEITAGTPEIEEPEWTEKALQEEREPFEGPA